MLNIIDSLLKMLIVVALLFVVAAMACCLVATVDLLLGTTAPIIPSPSPILDDGWSGVRASQIPNCLIMDGRAYSIYGPKELSTARWVGTTEAVGVDVKFVPAVLSANGTKEVTR